MERVKLYEISFWVRDSENSEKDALASLKEELFKLGGEIIKEPRPTLRRPTYPLEKETEALYGAIFARLARDKVEALKEKVKHEKDILRLMITEALPEKPYEAKRPARKPKRISPPGGEKPTSLEDLDKKLKEILQT